MKTFGIVMIFVMLALGGTGVYLALSGQKSSEPPLKAERLPSAGKQRPSRATDPDFSNYTLQSLVREVRDAGLEIITPKELTGKEDRVMFVHIDFGAFTLTECSDERTAKRLAAAQGGMSWGRVVCDNYRAALRIDAILRAK